MEKEDKLELSKSKEADKLKLASLEKATIICDPTQPPPKKQRTKNVDGTIIGTITYSISIYYTELIQYLQEAINHPALQLSMTASLVMSSNSKRIEVQLGKILMNEQLTLKCNIGI
jgi:hypothetical protein